MLLVAGVDALGTVACKKIAVELETGNALKDRHADFLGAAGVNGGLVDHDVAALQYLAHRGAGLFERRQVGTLVIVDRGRHGHDEHAAAPQFAKARGELQALRGAQLTRFYFKCAVAPARQFLDPLGPHVESHGFIVPPKFDCERQANIAKADDADAALAQVQ
jgi:hypothetical protein